MGRPLEASLVGLLGDTRAEVVDLLRQGSVTVAALAERLSLSEPAIRRHLQALERDGLVATRTVQRAGPGRPSAHYALTDRARRLYPDRSADLANELMEYVETTHGRPALLQFMRWRQARQADRYAQALEGVDDHADRAARLAELLSEDGFLADLRTAEAPDGATVLELAQGHCAVADVAAEHPEICAYEAALFQRVLGGRLSRRQTIAQGASACVCTIAPIVPPDRAPSSMTSTSTGATHVHQG